MKKRLLSSLCAASAVAMLIGCGDDSATPFAPTQVSSSSQVVDGGSSSSAIAPNSGSSSSVAPSSNASNSSSSERTKNFSEKKFFCRFDFADCHF